MQVCTTFYEIGKEFLSYPGFYNENVVTNGKFLVFLSLFYEQFVLVFRMSPGDLGAAATETNKLETSRKLNFFYMASCFCDSLGHCSEFEC